MATLPQLRAGYTTLQRRLVRGGGNIAANLFLGLDNWGDPDYERYLALLQPRLDGVKIQAARLQAAYYAEMAALTGQTFTAVSVSSSTVSTQILRGVGLEDVYRRPFVTLYTALSKGKTVSDAVSEGAARAFSLGSTDVKLSTTHTGRSVRGGNNNIVGYRRVLSGGPNCALCVIASTQRYTVDQLQPIHPGCSCGEEPIYGQFDPGQVIDPELLEETQDLVARELEVDADRGARDAGLSKVITSPTAGEKLADYTDLIVTREHGEYGPTLSFRDQSFTRRRDIPAVLDGGI
jgi:hypothetical protein